MIYESAWAPYRISIICGGSDLPEFYTKYNGQAFSFTINIGVKVDWLKDDPSVIVQNYYRNDLGKFTAMKMMNFLKVNDNSGIKITHGITREGKKIKKGSGSGLGSSSSAAVATSCVFRSEKNKLSVKDIAELAAKFEINCMGMPIGKQDHYAAAFGGLNRLTFYKTGEVSCRHIELDSDIKELLNTHTCLLDLDAHGACEVLKSQKSDLEDKKSLDRLKSIVDLIEPCEESLLSGDITKFGSYIKESWDIKSNTFSYVSSDSITEKVQRIYSYGAFGCKVVGAGGRGFIFVVCDPKIRKKITENTGLRRLKYNFTTRGVSIL